MTAPDLPVFLSLEWAAHKRSRQLSEHRAVQRYLAAASFGACIAVGAINGVYHPAAGPLAFIAAGCMWWSFQLSEGIKSIEQSVKQLDRSIQKEEDPEGRRQDEEYLGLRISRSVWRYLLLGPHP